jgi:Antitoxin-like ribbon-helix-helix
MSKNKPNLGEFLADTAGSTRVRKAPAPVDSAPASRPKSVKEIDRTSLLGTHVPDDVKDQFKLLAAREKKSINNLHAEAINDLFAKYGMPEIAPIAAKRRKGTPAAPTEDEREGQGT